MDFITLGIQLVSGLVGGQLGGAMMRNMSLGVLGNTVAGLAGGWLGGNVLGKVLHLPAATVDGVLGDPMAIAGQTGAGGAGGLALVILLGLLRGMLAKSQ